jgi:hypothetical protein
MARVYKAPQEAEIKEEDVTLFLGGSIDMGSAENWQDRIARDLDSYNNLVMLNPRRDGWDSSWEHDPTPGSKFFEQVDWELKWQEESTLLIYYFSPDSKAPITLLELGLFADSTTIVFCPKSFYRYGNVRMVCDRYGILMFETYDDFVRAVRKFLDLLECK